MKETNRYQLCIELIHDILIYNQKLKRLRLREEFWENEIKILELQIIFASWELEYLVPEKYKSIVVNLSPLVPLLR